MSIDYNPILKDARPASADGGATFMPKAEQDLFGKQMAGGIANTFNNATSAQVSATPLAQISGYNHIEYSTALKTDIAPLEVGENAAVNVQAANTASATKADVGVERGAFEQDLAQTQAVLLDALDQSAEALDLDRAEVMNSFQPAPSRSEAGVLAGAVVGNEAASAIMAADIASAMDKKLSDEDMSRVAEQLQRVLLAVHDANSNGPNNTFSPKINAAFIEQAQPRELVEAVKQVMRPAEDQPEAKAFDDLENKLDKVLAQHQSMEDANDKVLAIDVSSADINVQYNAFSVEAIEFPPARIALVDEGFDISDVKDILDSDNDIPLTALHNEPEELVQRPGMVV